MRDPIVGLIATQRADLLALLAGVEGGAWNAGTACDPWTVKDVLAHLVEGELNVGRVYRREVTEPGFVDGDEGVARWSPLPGPAVRAAFWQHGVATQRVLDAMTEEVWRAPIKAFGCREIRQLVRLHLFDLAVHGHDISDGIEAPPIWGPALPFLVEFVVRAAPLTFARHGHAPTAPLRVSSGGRAWVLRGEGDRWEVDHDAATDAAAAVEIEPEDLVLATTGRLAVDDALARASVAGDPDLAAQTLRAWRVV